MILARPRRFAASFTARTRPRFGRQSAVIAETLREGGPKRRRRQKNLKSRDSVLTRFVKSLIVPPAIRLLTSVRQQPDTKILPAKRRRSARPRVRACRNLFARLMSQSPPEATGVLCPPGTRRFRAFYWQCHFARRRSAKFSPVSCRGAAARVIEEPCMKSAVHEVSCLFLSSRYERCVADRLLRAPIFRRMLLPPLARPGGGIQQVGRGEHQGLSRLVRRDPPPVLHRRKAATIRQVQERGPAIRIERQAINDARARGQSQKPVENDARTLRLRRTAN
jgi:hypothetical protein